jgi:hypothetical protein
VPIVANIFNSMSALPAENMQATMSRGLTRLLYGRRGVMARGNAMRRLHEPALWAPERVCRPPGGIGSRMGRPV